MQIVSHWFSHNLIDRLTKRMDRLLSFALKGEIKESRRSLGGELRDDANGRHDNRDGSSEFKLKRYDFIKRFHESKAS